MVVFAEPEYLRAKMEFSKRAYEMISPSKTRLESSTFGELDHVRLVTVV